jgi:ribosomal protein L16 Arg81 hydroxylase
VIAGRKDRSTTSRLLPDKLIAQLQNGATLVVDAVDEIYEPLTTLATSLERELGEKIQVNLYAGWHTEPGFNIHWDGHDVIVLQLAGRKAWAIYGETRKHPLANDIVKDGAPPSEPIWQQTIADGDLLYIPRGFWHVAKPLDEPSLHLTIGIPNRTGIDLMTWFVDRLKGSEVMRKDLPRFKCRAERDAHLDEMFGLLRQELNAGLLDDFLADHDGKAVPRIRLNLPDVASKASLDDLLGRKFILATPRKPRLIDEGELTVLFANRKKFRFKNSARPLLEGLDHREPRSVDDLVNLSAGLDANTVKAFVKELLSFGLLAAVEDDR